MFKCCSLCSDHFGISVLSFQLYITKFDDLMCGMRMLSIRWASHSCLFISFIFFFCFSFSMNRTENKTKQKKNHRSRNKKTKRHKLKSRIVKMSPIFCSRKLILENISKNWNSKNHSKIKLSHRYYTAENY